MNPDLIIERLKRDHDSLLQEILDYYNQREIPLCTSEHFPSLFSIVWYIRSVLGLPLPYDKSFLHPEQEDRVFIRDIDFLTDNDESISKQSKWQAVHYRASYSGH